MTAPDDEQRVADSNATILRYASRLGDARDRLAAVQAVADEVAATARLLERRYGEMEAANGLWGVHRKLLAALTPGPTR